MSTLEELLRRNREFAAREAATVKEVRLFSRGLANLKAIVITCADMRVDPAYVLGIRPGETVVIRNIGGRVTPGLLEQMGLLGRIGEVAKEIPGGGGEFHLIVMHHTDCGITRLAADTEKLARYFQIEESEVGAKRAGDPRAAVAVDVAALRAIPALPAKWLLSGLVYDVATGLAEVVVAAAAIRGSKAVDAGD